jgi:hypothetical protein
MVQYASAVLGTDGGQVVRHRVGGDAQRLRERRLMMLGAPHHQGNLSLNEFVARWVQEFIYLF